MIVDDHAVVREGLASLLRTEPDLDFVGWAANCADALAKYEEVRPDVVLLDVMMPGIGGVATLEALLHKHPRARVLMLSSHLGDDTIHRCLRLGAVGYLLKTAEVDEIIRALRLARTERVAPSAQVAEQLAGRSFFEPLSPRELEVLRHVAQGASNKEVAAQLGLSESTIKNHVNTILHKLCVTDRTEAVTLASRRGLIDLGD